jgi:hypothetical protein
VDQICATGTPPAPTGGTIADGTYVLTAATDYACEGGPPPGIGSVAVVITGGCFNDVVTFPVFDGGTESATESSQLSVSGTTFTLNRVCPSPETTVVSYSATSTEFTTLSSLGVLEVYTKQ